MSKSLENRSGYKKYFNPKKDPFYSIYNVGEYTFSKYKTVWREQASFLTCAVVGEKDGKLIIPDHKLMLSPFDNLEEAHYVCACLSSSIAQFIVKSYTLETSISTHVLNYIKIPKFDFKNSVHKKLSDLSAKAHKFAEKNDKIALQKIEQDIDELAAEFWGLSKIELKDIKDSLEDLTD